MSPIRINTSFVLGVLRHWKRMIFLLSLIVLLIVEEVNYGYFYTIYMNHYNKEVTFPVTVKRADTQRIPIGIVIVLGSNEDKRQYELALDTVTCYAAMHNYTLYTVVAKEQPKAMEKCRKHKDFMFLRHCIVSFLSLNWPEQWLLFLDADMGVINPNHLIEEYLPRKPDQSQIVFYQRIMNNEVMAGSYLFRNADYARKFLSFWANYEFKVPQSFHGTDNGAIHSAIVEFALPALLEERKMCEKLWKKSRDYETLAIYEICIQDILVQIVIPEIKILQKGRISWARDGWLTSSMWSPRDFILHGWQAKRLNRQIFARWDSPLINSRFDLQICDSNIGFTNWRYKDTFIASDIDINRHIHDWIEDVRTKRARLERKIIR